MGHNVYAYLGLRTGLGHPCFGPAMRNGRYRMHGGRPDGSHPMGDTRARQWSDGARCGRYSEPFQYCDVSLAGAAHFPRLPTAGTRMGVKVRPSQRLPEQAAEVPIELTKVVLALHSSGHAARRLLHFKGGKRSVDSVRATIAPLHRPHVASLRVTSYEVA